MQEQFIQFRSLQKCLLCSQSFERTPIRLPRVMYCGHNICSGCVKNQVVTKHSLTCPHCFKNFSKQACAQFQINYFYLDMIEYLEYKFGNLKVYQTTNFQGNHQSQGKINEFNGDFFFSNNSVPNNGIFNEREVKKCKNSSCYNQTDLIFCSQQCNFQFGEVQTKKNEGHQFNRRSSDFMHQI